jgi:hypothetical protein
VIRMQVGDKNRPKALDAESQAFARFMNPA